MRMIRLNYNSLRYFIEVAETLSFTKASKNLFVSQPGISQQIHLLETQLGVKLLNRTTRNVTLTEEGKFLYNKTLPSLNEIKGTMDQITEGVNFPSVIKIASIPSAASLFLPSILDDLHKAHPKIEFDIKETTSNEVVKLIKNHTSHLGFIRSSKHTPNLFSDDLSKTKFSRSEVKAIVSSKHRLAHLDSIHLSELKDDFFLHYNKETSASLYHLLEEACMQAGFTPKTISSGSELLTVSNLISHNLGVTLMPNDMVELIVSPDIKALDLDGINLESSITAIWHDAGYINTSTQLLLNFMKKLQSQA